MNSETLPEQPLEREPTTRVEGETNAAERPEQLPQREIARVDRQPAAPPPAPIAPTPPAPPPAPYVREIEEVMSEDLADFYRSMTPAQQQAFKVQGEETARTIAMMIEQARVQAKRVLKLIAAWLKLIPGVNKFFLEQEAKIKTDKILALAQDEEQRRAR